MLSRAPLWLWLALAVALALVLALALLFGCEAVDEGGVSSSRPGDSTVEVQPEDKAMAADVQRYFRRNATEAPWYEDIESISVVGGVITVDTVLDLGEPPGRTAAVQICSLIQGSDVADFTPGHTVRDEGDDRVVCPARRS